jgi:hypothetical protein
MGNYGAGGTSNNFCSKCGKPFIYIGDVFDYSKGQEPWCTCNQNTEKECAGFPTADDKIVELLAQVKALKAENELLAKKYIASDNAMHDLKAENERLTTKDFLLREKIRILEEKPNPVSVEEMADIIYDNKFKGGVNTKQYILVVPEDIAQALFDRIYKDKPKVICDELPSGKGLLIKNPDFSEWKRGGGEAPDEWVAKHDKPEDNNLINLLDSVLPIVETWNAETPAQKEWKENILKQIKGVIKLDKPKEPIKTEKLEDIHLPFTYNEYSRLSGIVITKEFIQGVIDHINKKGV